jgi:hypothetical protein
VGNVENKHLKDALNASIYGIVADNVKLVIGPSINPNVMLNASK